MKTYKISESKQDIFKDGLDCGGLVINNINEISDLEYKLLINDFINEIPYRQDEIVYVDLQDSRSEYILRSDIEETEYFTKQEVMNYSLELLKFLTRHSEINFNPVLQKWDTRYGVGYQTNEQLIRLFEANKSKIDVDQYTELLHNMREQTFHMNDEQSFEVVDEFIKNHPDLLRYRDLEWFYKNV